MFSRVSNFFTGRVRFLVKSRDFRILNRLRVYKLSDITINDEMLGFTVALKHANQVERCLPRNEYCKSVNKNFFGLLNVFYTRRFLSIAAVVCLIVFLISNIFIFRVEIVGASAQETREISRFVRASGIKPLMAKGALQQQSVASRITAEFDFVAHASSKIVGHVLYFKIYCVELAGDKNNNDDIVAAFDGVVTNVIVASGTAAVKAGDVVRKGDVLIKGEYRVGEEIFKKTRAIGEVMADVSYSEFGFNTTADELLAKIVARTGIKEFDKVETFTPQKDILEVVATINISIV